MFDAVGPSGLFYDGGTLPDFGLEEDRLEFGTQSFSWRFNPGFACDFAWSLTLTVLIDSPSPSVDAFVASPIWTEPETEIAFSAGKPGLSSFDDAASRAYLAERGFIGQAPKARMGVGEGAAARGGLSDLDRTLQFTSERGGLPARFSQRTAEHFASPRAGRPFTRLEDIQRAYHVPREGAFNILDDTIRYGRLAEQTEIGPGVVRSVLEAPTGRLRVVIERVGEDPLYTIVTGTFGG